MIYAPSYFFPSPEGFLMLHPFPGFCSDFCFCFEYPSLNHPPPFNSKDIFDIFFVMRSCFPCFSWFQQHFGHNGAGSFIDCRVSFSLNNCRSLSERTCACQDLCHASGPRRCVLAARLNTERHDGVALAVSRISASWKKSTTGARRSCRDSGLESAAPLGRRAY